MNTRYSLLLLSSLLMLSALLCAPLHGDHHLSYTLKDLGYRSPIVLQGPGPALSLSVPLYPTSHLADSNITIKMKLSPALDPDSTFVFTINGNPLKELSAKELRNTPSLTFPLTNVAGSSDQFILGINAQLALIDGNVRDPDERDAWFVVDNTTGIHLSIEPPSSPIIQFFTNGSPQITLVPIDNDPKTIEATLQISAAIGACYFPWKLEAQVEKSSQGTKTIFVGSTEQSLKVHKGSLYVSLDNTKTLIQTLHSLSVKPEPPAVSLSDGELSYHRSLSLAGLKQPAHTVKGSGEMVIPIPFTIADFHGLPKTLECVITFAHSPIPNKGEGYLSFKLNSLLVSTFPLSSSGGKRQYKIKLPVSELKTQNILFVNVATYVPPTYDLLNLEGTLYRNSFFTVSGDLPEINTNFAQFSSRWKRDGTVILSDLSHNYYRAAAKILELMARTLGRNGTIHLQTETQNLQNASDYVILALKPSHLSRYQPLIDIAHNFELVDPATERTLLQANLDHPLGMLQIFNSQDDTPVLAISDTSSEPLEWVDHLTTDRLTSQTGEILVFQQGAWYASSSNSELLTRYSEQWDFSKWWSRYKSVIVLIAGIFIINFITYVYRKLTVGDVSNEKD